MKTLALLSIMLLLIACGGTPAAPPQPEPPVVAAPEPARAQEPTPQPEKPAAAPAGNDAKTIEYDQSDFITNVACNYEKGTVSFTLKNIAGKDLTIYHGEVPQAENSLKISMNGMQFNSPKLDVKLDCGDTVIKAGETRSCSGENIQYRLPSAAFNQKGKNRMLAQWQGGSDVTFFECTK